MAPDQDILLAIFSVALGLRPQVEPSHSSIFSTREKRVWIARHDGHFVDGAAVAVEERVEGLLLAEDVRVQDRAVPRARDDLMVGRLGRGGRWTSLDASFARCFAIFGNIVKTSHR